MTLIFCVQATSVENEDWRQSDEIKFFLWYKKCKLQWLMQLISHFCAAHNQSSFNLSSVMSLPALSCNLICSFITLCAGQVACILKVSQRCITFFQQDVSVSSVRGRGVCRVHNILSISVPLTHSAPVRSVTAPAATSSLKKSFSALTSCTTWATEEVMRQSLEQT